jgi:hypothetical protein
VEVIASLTYNIDNYNIHGFLENFGKNVQKLDPGTFYMPKGHDIQTKTDVVLTKKFLYTMDPGMFIFTCKL